MIFQNRRAPRLFGLDGVGGTQRNRAVRNPHDRVEGTGLWAYAKIQRADIGAIGDILAKVTRGAGGARGSVGKIL